jgi:hypothetical protein
MVALTDFSTLTVSAKYTLEEDIFMQRDFYPL